jgi:hypothetical protein
MRVVGLADFSKIALVLQNSDAGFEIFEINRMYIM